ncbi:MAG: preprotein translocase, SecY subunit [Parcubacteria bacterium C7867-005]|nr:MAG: preprotein translocase, SecY subunit [Parcubacteria bacterium C7867-005]
MKEFVQKLRLIFSEPILRKRIFITLAILVTFRILAAIPIPGIDTLRLESLFADNQFLSLLNVFSGGGLSTLSIVMLGVSPYITASIIMQLLTLMVPKFKSMYQEEGDAGRRRFSQYSRILAVPLAVIQAYSFIVLFQRQGVLPPLSLISFIVDMSVIVAGSMLLVWIGELVTEFGVGNGVSLIIFAGIVSALPASIGQLIFTFSVAQIPVYLVSLVVVLLVIYGVVFVTEAERPIPITYAKQARGGASTGGISTYLPLRVNQAGVIPIIFALSILLFPQMILQFLNTSKIAAVADTASKLLALLANQWFYGIAYFVLVFLFTYFYTAVTVDPDQMSTNLQKSGAFIPGIRPGQSTAEYLSKVITRLTLVGALFLSFVAVLPLILRGITGIQSLAIGGTGLLIVVSVVIDLMKKINAQVSVREY